MPTPFYRVKSAELLVSGTNPEHLSMQTILLPLTQGQGYIFGFIDVTHRDQETRERLIHSVASHLEVFRSDIDKDGGNIPRRFEAMLVTINADLSRVAKIKNILLKKTNILIGVATNTQVFLSGIGQNHAVFLHRTAERRYIVYELDAQLQSEENTWEKPLVTVLDGELHPGDVFYIASRIPPHALSLGDLQDILITLPPGGALERIQQFVPPTAHYGGICFHVTEDEPAGQPKKANPMTSLSQLEETKSRTADLLGEQTPDMQKKALLVLEETKKILATYSNNPFIRGVKRMTRGAAEYVTKKIAQKQQEQKTQGPRRSGTHHHSRGIGGTLSTLRHAGVTAVVDASRTTKTIGVIIAVVIIVAAIGIANRRASQKTAETEQVYQSALTKIEEKRTAAEAALIYGNTQNAQTLITDASNILATLPRTTTAEKTKASELKTALQIILEKTRGIESVTPVKIAELPAQFAFPLVDIVSSGSAIYGITSDNAPYRVNEVSKTLERVDVGQSPAQTITVTTNDGDTLLGVDMDKRLWRTTIVTPTVTATTSGTDAMKSVDDICSYNSNLYALSAATGQIVKMRPEGLGFEAGTPWILAKTSDLSQARALTIDGSAWVLTPTNIVVFKSGRETPWTHAAIDPSLTKPSDIWTSVDSKYLYILDSNDGKVVVMNKDNGGIVVQYSPNLTNVTGFVVRESENRILLTTATTVYSYTATHLLK